MASVCRASWVFILIFCSQRALVSAEPSISLCDTTSLKPKCNSITSARSALEGSRPLAPLFLSSYSSSSTFQVPALTLRNQIRKWVLLMLFLSSSNRPLLLRISTMYVSVRKGFMSYSNNFSFLQGLSRSTLVERELRRSKGEAVHPIFGRWYR